MSGRLRGRVVVVSRDLDPDDALAAALRAEDAEVRCWPTRAYAPAEDPTPLREALHALASYDWVAFTSPRAVAAAADVASHERLAPPAGRGPPRVAAVGASTARALRERGWPVAVVNAGVGAADLVRTLAAGEDPSGAVVLFVAGSLARDTLARELAVRGARVTRVEAYRTLLTPPDGARVREDLARGVDAVTFASPSAVDGVALAVDGDLAGALDERPTVAIGPTTARALVGRGVRRVLIADEAGFAGIVAAVARALAGEPSAAEPHASGPSPSPAPPSPWT
jgi:uroporphyrinogen-III synthase